MERQQLIDHLTEIDTYLGCCIYNAAAESKAKKRFSGWLSAIREALKLLTDLETSYKDCGKTFMPDGEIGRLYICEFCDFIGYNCKKGMPNYCPNCGKKVKWDD